jgi:hypothetical protein
MCQLRSGEIQVLEWLGSLYELRQWHLFHDNRGSVA